MVTSQKTRRGPHDEMIRDNLNMKGLVIFTFLPDDHFLPDWRWE